MAQRKPRPRTLNPDPVLESYRKKLAESVEPREKSDFLVGFIQYLRRRYRSTNDFRDEIVRFTNQLEAAAARIQSKELIPISRAISYSRKFVASTDQRFGEELHKAPRGNDLRAIRRLKSPKLSDLIDPTFEFDMDELDREGMEEDKLSAS